MTLDPGLFAGKRKRASSADERGEAGRAATAPGGETEEGSGEGPGSTDQEGRMMYPCPQDCR